LTTATEVVRAVTVPTRVAPCPELLLRLAAEPLEPWAATEVARGTMQEAPFWAHAWPGGLALARTILDDPASVQGRHVLDFASGCGVAAIAAARGLATTVVATELDEFALAAIAENARLNQVDVRGQARDVIDTDDGWDVVLVGDVFYRADVAQRLERWLHRLVARGALVLIGDPGRQFLPIDRLRCVATCSVPPNPAWDSVVDRQARVWALREATTPDAPTR
jgi:predicted nicotinamide N-methyase